MHHALATCHRKLWGNWGETWANHSGFLEILQPSDFIILEYLEWYNTASVVDPGPRGPNKKPLFFHGAFDTSFVGKMVMKQKKPRLSQQLASAPAALQAALAAHYWVPGKPSLGCVSQDETIQVGKPGGSPVVLFNVAMRNHHCLFVGKSSQIICEYGWIWDFLANYVKELEGRSFHFWGSFALYWGLSHN